jgi:hypothetical protein
MRLKQAKVGDRFKIDLASRAGKQTPVKATLVEAIDNNYVINTDDGNRFMCDGYELITLLA